MNLEEIMAFFTEKGFEEIDAFFYAQKAMNFAPELKQVYDRYLQTGETPVFQYQKWDLKTVAEHTHAPYLFAFNFMDRLMKDPQYAKCFDHIQYGRK